MIYSLESFSVTNSGKFRLNIFFSVFFIETSKERSKQTVAEAIRFYSRQKHVVQWNPVNTATLFWSEETLSQSFSYFKNRFNTATPLIRPVFCDPLITRLTRFHCSLKTADHIISYSELTEIPKRTRLQYRSFH